MYSYDRRLAAEDETKAAIKQLGPKRKQAIKSALKAMSAQLEKLEEEARKEFPKASWSSVMEAMRKGEESIRNNLQG